MEEPTAGALQEPLITDRSCHSTVDRFNILLLDETERVHERNVMATDNGRVDSECVFRAKSCPSPGQNSQ